MSDLYRILQAYNITEGPKGEVIIKNTIIPWSSMKKILQALTDPKVGYVPGLSDVLNELPKKVLEGFIPKQIVKSYRTGPWIPVP